MNELPYLKIEKSARACWGRSNEIDDIIQDGYMGAWKARDKYNPDNEQGCSRDTYLVIKAMSAMRDGIRNRRPGTRTKFFEFYPLEYLPGDPSVKGELDGDLIAKETVAAIVAACKDVRDKEIVHGLLNGANRAEIAEGMGVTGSAITIRMRRIKKELARGN